MFGSQSASQTLEAIHDGHPAVEVQVDIFGSCAIFQSCFESDAKGATRPVGLRIYDFSKARRS
jgi:hypothetical protein